MIGEIDWFGQIVGGVSDGEITANARIAKALIRAGLAVVIIEPNGKLPACIYSARDAKKANTEAQNAAREAGNPNWERVRHECGIKHAITEEKVLNRARVKELFENGANIAVAPGASSRRVLVVDVDTAEEKRAFLSDWAAATGEDMGEKPLTVTSPGVISANVNGEDVWTHKNGGHFWFSVPDGVELPERPGKLTWCECHGVQQPKGGCRNSWAAYYGSGYVLVPPSVRQEGAYRLTGAAENAPEWLTTLICQSRTPEREDGRTGALSAFSDDPIDQWAQTTTWEEILTGDGFRPHDHDTCGCPTFTRPGDATHSKSVTAHEAGCSQYDTSAGHGPLRIWSDALGSGTMSKLNYVAKFHHDGNTGAAMRSLGLTAMRDESADDDLVLGDAIPKARNPESPNGASGVPSVDDDQFAPLDWDELWEEEFVTEFLPGMLLEKGQQAALVGDGKAGKSLIIFDWCVKLVQGQPFLTENTGEPLKVLYLDKENSRKDIVTRAWAVGADKAALKSRFTYLSFPPFKPLDSRDGALQVMAIVDKYQPDVVILDTVSRFITGKENESDTWLALYRLLHANLKARNIAGIRLDHFGKDAEKGGRGSSAKSQDIDHVWELSVDSETKDRNGAGVEVETILTLKRTHSRTGLGPDYHKVKRRGVKTADEREWIPGETRHELADAFDIQSTELEQIQERPTSAMRLICDALRDTENGMPLRTIRESVPVKNTTVDYALELLITEGFVKRERVGRANIHTLIKDMPEEDQ